MEHLHPFLYNSRTPMVIDFGKGVNSNEWGISWITDDNVAAADLGFIQLDSTSDLFVSGDTLYFRSVFDCRFPQ